MPLTTAKSYIHVAYLQDSKRGSISGGDLTHYKFTVSKVAGFSGFQVAHRKNCTESLRAFPRTIRNMAKHTVKFRTPALDVSKVDVVFRVKRNGQAFGRLRISKGGIEWMQKSDSKKAFHMSWEDVDKKFPAHVAPGKTRSKKKP